MVRFTVTVFTDKNTTIDELLKPYGIREKVKKMIIKTKKDLISEERKSIIRHSHIMEKCIRLCTDKHEKERQKRAIEYLNDLSKLNDEEIYKLAIKKYDKSLLTEDGSLIDYYNPYCHWTYYEKNSEYTKLLVIENPNKKGEYIYTNSAKDEDIKWDKVDHRALFTNATVFPDGTWYDEQFKTITKINKKEDGTLEYKQAQFEDVNRNVKSDWQVTIVECFI